MRLGSHRSAVLCRHARVLVMVTPLFVSGSSFAQSAHASETETIRGTVLNSVTHEPIPGALVASPDSRFATRTDSQGRFEFTVPKAQPAQPPPTESPNIAEAEVPESLPGPSETSEEPPVIPESPRPVMLTARKPGFLENTNASALDLAQRANEITLFLEPEAVIAGHVSLPSAEGPDKIQLQLFTKVVQNGVAQWAAVGSATSKSNGDFRFAELRSGTYKLLTSELLDRDPLNSGPQNRRYGYPPVYYPDATDFAAAGEITLTSGQTAEPQLALVKKAYYPVKVALVNPQPGVSGFSVNVASEKGHTGPGYSLGYNSSTQQIEGMLPNGTYSVEVSSFGENPAAGNMTLVVKGAPVKDAKITLQPAASLLIDVKEEFTEKVSDSPDFFTDGKRKFQDSGARRYLNVFLESADEFNSGRGGTLRPPSGPDDNKLDIPGVLPGRYWVRVQSAHGYAASVHSGTTDLLGEPLVVGEGGTTIPIEITVRDDSAQIAGEVEELAASPKPVVRGMPPAFVYCVPLPESTGQFAEIGVAPNGTFSSQPLPPGEYRVLAFDRQQTALEYRNPEIMKVFDGKGPVVQVAGGQTEHVTLQLSSTRE